MIQKYLIDLDNKWNIQLIQGFVGYFEHNLESYELKFYLITRRSWKRSGTRFTHRGYNK